MNFREGFTDQNPEYKKYEEKYKGSVIVLKAGGEVIEGMLEPFLYDTAILQETGSRPVIVYGAKKRINTALEDAGINDMGRVDGNRVTSEEMLRTMETVSEDITEEIISGLRKHGAKAEGGFMRVTQYQPKSGKYVGFVGDPIDAEHKIRDLLESGVIPIIPFIGTSQTGQKYNTNADHIACVAAPRLGARSLLYLTDVEGVLDGHGKLISELTHEDAEEMLKAGIINSGMAPKVTCALKAKSDGVEAVHIIDGMQENAILYELFTDSGRGTIIK